MPALSLAAVPGRRQRTIDLATEIEKRGFTGIFGPSLGDSMAMCQSIAEVTNEIPIGTSVVNIYARNVLDWAQSAAYLHEVTDGRFRWGVGVSHAPANNRLGVTTGKPLTDMRDFVSTCREAKRIGDLPPIILAAMRDKMCATAAEIGEGMVFANAARSAFPGTLARLKDAADVDGDWMIAGMIPTTISDDKDAAAAVNRRTLTGYVALPNYRNYWRDNGYEEEMNGIADALEAGDRDKVQQCMTDTWLSDVTLYGSANEVRDGLEAWFDAGLTTPILVPSAVEGGQFQAFEDVFAAFA